MIGVFSIIPKSHIAKFTTKKLDGVRSDFALLQTEINHGTLHNVAGLRIWATLHTYFHRNRKAICCGDFFFFFFFMITNKYLVNSISMTGFTILVDFSFLLSKKLEFSNSNVNCKRYHLAHHSTSDFSYVFIVVRVKVKKFL